MARHVRVMPPLLILALLAAGITSAQQPGPQAPPAPVGAAPLTALVDQLVDLFPKLEGEVVEVRDGAIALGAGVKAGARPGLEVEMFREGREIKHPKTGAVLGHAENLVREGLLAVVFKGPAGFRLQSINSGCEGGITCLGAYMTEDAAQPTIIAAVVRYNNVLLKAGGETQIIMTVPQD